jgi:hypothetical protein
MRIRLGERGRTASLKKACIQPLCKRRKIPLLNIVTLIPKNRKVFLQTFLWVVGLIIIFSGIIPYFQGAKIETIGLITSVIPGIILGIFVILFFTPQELTWDDSRFKIKMIFGGTKEFSWSDLDAWCPESSNGVFLLRFKNCRMTFQISPIGFRKEEWENFKTYFEQKFQEKKRTVWIGTIPINFERK